MEEDCLFFTFGFYDTVEVETVVLDLAVYQSRMGPQDSGRSFELFGLGVVGAGSDLPRFACEGEAISLRQAVRMNGVMMKVEYNRNTCIGVNIVVKLLGAE